MAENDYKKEIDKITKRAVRAKRRELAEEKIREKETEPVTMQAPRLSSIQEERKSTTFTVVIVAKLEYDGDNIPSKEQLAEDIGNTVIKWVNQKDFYAITPKDAVPRLISVDVDVK